MTVKLPIQAGQRVSASVALSLAVTATLAFSPSAQAGKWALDSCRQPNGQPAPTEGWSTSPIGTPGFFTEGVDSCGTPGGALVAVSDGRWVQPASSGYMWKFTAPAGSVIAGGQLGVHLTAPHGITAVLTPEESYDSVDQVVVCGVSEGCGESGPSTSVAIDHPGGTSLYAIAICFPFGEGCGTTSGVNAETRIDSARIELESTARPAGDRFSGGVLAREASGVQQLLFTASEPTGPGIWRVNAVIDKTPIYEITPDANSGKCQSVGTDPNGAAEFLYAQPCPQSETVSVPVDTAALSSGHHQMTVAVTDAAGNTSTVFDGPIDTLNLASLSAWTVSLAVSPRHVRRHTTITLLGRVTTTPRPPQGKLVYLQARSVGFRVVKRGRRKRRVAVDGPWITFKHLRTKSSGKFGTTYRFRLGGVHTYQFQAVAPSEGEFHNPTGTSTPVEVTERP
jgi:hypothetical protein